MGAQLSNHSECTVERTYRLSGAKEEILLELAPGEVKTLGENAVITTPRTCGCRIVSCP